MTDAPLFAFCPPYHMELPKLPDDWLDLAVWLAMVVPFGLAMMWLQCAAFGACGW